MEGEEPRGQGIFLHVYLHIHSKYLKVNPRVPHNVQTTVKIHSSDDLISSDLSIVTQVCGPHLDSLQIHAAVLDE